MEDIKMLKEKAINNYMSGVDIDNLDANQVKSDLHQLLGEIPAIKFNYEQETLMNEDGSEGKKLEKLDSIEIIFTYNKEIEVGGKTQSVPIPVPKKFFI